MSKHKEKYNHIRDSLIALTIVIAGISFQNNLLCSYINTLDIYMSSDSTQADTNSSFLYPKISMGTGVTNGPNDWTYNNVRLTSYVIPIGDQSILSADFTLRFDSTLVRVTAQAGDLFTSYFIDTLYISTGTLRINISSLGGNVMPEVNKHLIKLFVYILKPSRSNISLTRSDIRYYDFTNNVQSVVPANVHNSTVVFYLGDFAASQSVLLTGDGKVDFNDGAIFGQSYGTSIGSPLYQTKFDIAPTAGNLDYWQMPVGDGQIGFLDLILFSIGYNFEGSGILDRLAAIKTGGNSFLNVISGTPLMKDDFIRIPVNFYGNVTDIRGISFNMFFDNSAYGYKYFEPSIASDNIFISGTAAGNILTIDAAVLGLSNSGFSAPGTLGYAVFEKRSMSSMNNTFPVISALARDSFAREIKLNVNVKKLQ